MWDEDPRPVSSAGLVKDELAGCAPAIVMYSDPFHKIEFLHALAGVADAVVVDMDLLYTGYVKAGLVSGDNVSFVHPAGKSWDRDLSRAVSRAHKYRSMLVIDSLNGTRHVFEDDYFSKYANLCMTILSSAGAQSGTPVVIMAMARKGSKGEWRLMPEGGRIVRPLNAGIFLLEKIDDLLIRRLDGASPPEQP